MPKKIYMSLLFTMVVALVALFAATPSVVQGTTPTPCDSRLPSCLSNFESFVIHNSCGYFNANSEGVVCEELETFDFAGTWEITAIATDASNDLDATWLGSPSVSYDTEDCSNWGISQEINFYEGNLRFSDRSAEYSADLDPFLPTEEGCGEGGDLGDFRVCRLTQDSNPLNYLPNPVTLRAGTYIVGFNNTGADCDHDDLFVALSSPEVEVCEADGRVTPSDGCVSITEIEAGTIYMSYQRVGDCEVNEEAIRFYLNSPLCDATADCPDEPVPGSSCQYIEDAISFCDEIDGDTEETFCDAGDSVCPSFCIDPADVNQILSTQPGFACNETMAIEFGSPTCVKYTTAAGTKIKTCVRPDGRTCSWKRCCKSSSDPTDPKCN